MHLLNIRLGKETKFYKVQCDQFGTVSPESSVFFSMTLHHSNLQVQDQVQVQLLLYCTDAVLHCLSNLLLYFCPIALLPYRRGRR